MIELYLVGALVAFGYQLADSDFRFYDLIVCPLAWPAVLPLQIAVWARGRAFVAKTKAEK